VTSNPVEVYIHPQVTNVALAGPKQCISQGQLWSTSNGTPIPLDAQACYSGPGGKQYELCAPAGTTRYACSGGVAKGVTSLPTCPNSIGALSFTVGNASIATINNVNNEITAEQPGTTVITASVAGSGSAAGYFSTCPPQSIKVTLANGATSGTITQGVQQSLVTTVLDTRGQPITGLTLDYQSTNPLNTTVASGGGITTNFPGTTTLYAVCQPSTCDPSPINEVGLNGTGLSISSNPVIVTTPGTASSYMFFAAPGKSQYFVPPEKLTGTPAAPARLPYVPNSMVMDQLGTNLYFGSAHELMVYSTTNDAISKEDPTVPGVVLAVAPNDSEILINDQVRQVFYIYSSSGTISASFAGIGNAAAWTPDSKTLYISDSASLGPGHSDTLYVYNSNSNWSTYDLSSSGGAKNLALTIPGAGAYLSGSPTVAHTWCPTGTAGSPPANASISAFYPQADSVPAATDVLTATTDGQHILGAALGTGGITLSDISFPKQDQNQLSAICPQAGTSLTALPITHDLNQTQIAVDATAVNQVVASPPPTLVNGSTSQAPSFAFITYDGTTPGAKLPYYIPSKSPDTLGTVGYVTLKGASSITAPVAGTFSPDNTIFFVSTAGDNKIHYIAIPTSPTGVPTDSEQFSPKLPACVPQSATDPFCTNPLNTPQGSFTPATVIIVKPRSTT
jgi:trimeric autotransporter adhesin